MIRSTLPLLISCIGFYSCTTPDSEPVFVSARQFQPPIERVSKMVVYYTSPLTSLNYVGKDTVNGQVYNFVGADTYTFQYDAQNRTVKHTLTQTSASDIGLYTHKNQYRYAYANGRMTEAQTSDAGTQTYSFPLDSTQSRVLAYTKRIYANALLDTLRQYSAEGILKSVLRGSNRQTITIDTKNITQIDEYSNRTGKLDNTTAFVYDMDHYAPPAYFTFLGETSQNTVVKRTINYGSQAQVDVYISTYQNTYDTQKRLIKQVEFSQYPGQAKPTVATVTTYSY
ncbi:hypothetical protein [Spirosoma foliorum]|uniref:DUF4595 domain-containing protein n=1 Tax=Spirosoma foliorum TaxID=2710596 RepID=A0A7G5GY55_9BACT|nr:hypothetical protein [Spirosoma foliorum]QMW03797.1 hypothetical protein H3H32_02235 [Spirosoma foliorum]